MAKYLLEVDGKALNIEIYKEDPLVVGQTITLPVDTLNNSFKPYKLTGIDDIYPSGGCHYTHAGVKHREHITIATLSSIGEVDT